MPYESPDTPTEVKAHEQAGQEEAGSGSQKASHRGSQTKKEGGNPGSGGDAYAELPGILVGRATGGHPGEPVRVTIHISGGVGDTPELVITLDAESAKKIPPLLDKDGKQKPPVPVKVQVLPGEGAPTPEEAEQENTPKEEDEDEDESKDPSAKSKSGKTAKSKNPDDEAEATPPDAAAALSQRDARSQGDGPRQRDGS